MIKSARRLQFENSTHPVATVKEPISFSSKLQTLWRAPSTLAPEQRPPHFSRHEALKSQFSARSPMTVLPPYDGLFDTGGGDNRNGFPQEVTVFS